MKNDAQNAREETRNAKEVLREGSRYLLDARVENAGQEAFLFLAEAVGRPDIRYFTEDDQVLPDERKRFESFLERRAAGEPMQYILGYAWFYGYQIYVNQNVLIPRFDTENLVEAALEITKHRAEVAALDLCTGSGAIGLTYGAERKKAGKKTEIMLLDISRNALAVARKNAEHIYPDASFLESDLFSDMNPDARFDVILSNPPYVTAAEMEELSAEVKDYEPKLALYGGEDGLDFYRKITEEAVRYLLPGGLLIFEIGCHQGGDVQGILQKNGFKDIIIKKDLSGKDRVVLGTKQ